MMTEGETEGVVPVMAACRTRRGRTGRGDPMPHDILRQVETPPALPVPQERAIAALLTGASVTAAATKAGVARQTVHRWLSDDPAFIAAYNLARREVAEAVAQSLRVLSLQSVRVLKRTLTSSKTPTAVKVQAAVAVLKMAAGAADGPTDVEDARVAVARREQQRRFARSTVPRLPGDSPGAFPAAGPS
jgi:hypothetical protein